CRYGLRTAYFDDLVDSDQISSVEDGRMNFAFLIRRRTKDDFFATGYIGGDTQHKNCRKEWRGPSGDLSPHLVEGLASSHAGEGRHYLHGQIRRDLRPANCV